MTTPTVSDSENAVANIGAFLTKNSYWRDPRFYPKRHLPYLQRKLTIKRRTRIHGNKEMSL